MTENEFFDALAITEGPWRLGTNGQIRTRWNTCPICAVAGKRGESIFRGSGDVPVLMGLSVDLTTSIISAADHLSTSWPALRQRLLAVTVERTS